MTAQVAMIGDLRDLRTKLKEQSGLMSREFKRVESEKKERDDERKRIVLEGLKAALKTLHDMDSDLVKEMKSEVYDKKEAIENLERKVAGLIKSVKSSEEEDEEVMRKAIKELTDDVAGLQLEQFSRLVWPRNYKCLHFPMSSCFELSVSSSPMDLAQAFKQVADVVLDQLLPTLYKKLIYLNR